MKEFKKALRALLLALLAYLVQACVMEYLTVSGVTGSVLFAVLAIITVSYGKKYAFCASCIIGMCMESMLSQVQALYVVAECSGRAAATAAARAICPPCCAFPCARG